MSKEYHLHLVISFSRSSTLGHRISYRLIAVSEARLENLPRLSHMADIPAEVGRHRLGIVTP
jgi:hypothetical protein